MKKAFDWYHFAIQMSFNKFRSNGVEILVKRSAVIRRKLDHEDHTASTEGVNFTYMTQIK